MKIFEQISDIRSERWTNPTATWGLVPTMGFLHEGHLSLVRRAKAENERVGVSIFVNPSQFNNADDLTSYPRDMERDLALLREAKVDLVWTPTPDIVYPTGYQTYIDVEQVSQPLEGNSRAGHFRGVATVVAKLFNVFQPHNVYFGQKDAQQVAVIRQMAQDLNFNLNIIACPTVREKDGLAMSSRNAKLSPNARQHATCLYRALSAAKYLIKRGDNNADTLRLIMSSIVRSTDMARVDYVSVAHPQTLIELDVVENSALLSLAVFIGTVRLIDNMVVEVGSDRI